MGLIFAVDFDGTVVEHAYPEIGPDVPLAVTWMRAYLENGAKLILWTMRSGPELADAVKWFDDRKLELYGINENPTQKSWTRSPKAYASYYFDDLAIGAPLVKFQDDRRPYLDWRVAGPLGMQLLKEGMKPI